MKLFTHPGGVGVTQTFFLPKCPQSIIFVAATVPTGLKVFVDNETVLDLDAAGISAVGRLRNISIPTNLYDITCGNGEIEGNTRIEFTTAAVGAIDVFGYSLGTGDTYCKTIKITATANSGLPLNKFAFAVIPTFASTDYAMVTYQNGYQIRLDDPTELRYLLSYAQAAQNNGNDLVIDNLDAIIKEVVYYPSAARDIYIARYVAA